MRSWDCQVSVSQRILLSLQTLCSQVKVLCVFFLRSPLLEMAGDFLVTLFILKYELVKDEIFYRKVHYCFIKDRISYQNQLSKQLTVKWWSHPKRAWECKDHLLVSSPGIIVKFPPSHVLFTILILLIRFFFFFFFLLETAEKNWESISVKYLKYLLKYQNLCSTGKLFSILQTSVLCLQTVCKIIFLDDHSVSTSISRAVTLE